MDAMFLPPANVTGTWTVKNSDSLPPVQLFCLPMCFNLNFSFQFVDNHETIGL